MVPLSKTVESSKFPVPTNSLEGDSYKVDSPHPTCLLATYSQDVHKNIHTFTYIGNIIYTQYSHTLCTTHIHLYVHSTHVHKYTHSQNAYTISVTHIAVIGDNVNIHVYITFEPFRFTQHTTLRCCFDVYEVLKSLQVV